MTQEKLLELFSALGKTLQSLSEKEKADLKRNAEIHNKWFTNDSVEKALEGLVLLLNKDNLVQWIKPYTFSPKKSKTVGVVMAGNIPFVGFHDLICVLISGHQLKAKLSSEDKFLMNWIINLIIELEPSLKSKILIEERLTNIDALIATGSDNTAKHFDYYFASIPRIIRRNRVSVAVLTGEESKAELTSLGKDMLTYYGLGCRNVSKIFIPEKMELTGLFEALEPLKYVINETKYANNYEYNRSIYLLKSITHLDNGFIIGVETTDLVSPIAVFYYERYTSIDDVKKYF